jgi:hypothetical protein
MADELEEINGIKPKVWLPDGEEREVASKSRYDLHFSRFNINPFATTLLVFDTSPSNKISNMIIAIYYYSVNR